MAQPQPAGSDPELDRSAAFAEFIRSARERKQWTQAELARHSGVAQATIQRWEAGREHLPQPMQVRAVCHALGVNPSLAAVALGFLDASVVMTPPDRNADWWRLLEELAVTDHQKPVDVLATLVLTEYDRRFPGKREYASEPLEIRRERVRQMMGWPETLPDDPEAERSLDEALAAVEAEAHRFYGEDAGQAAA